MLKSAPFFWIVCDDCGARTPDADAETVAWSSAADAVESAACSDWSAGDGKHYCPECWMKRELEEEGD